MVEWSPHEGPGQRGKFQTSSCWGSKATDVGEDSKWDGLQRTGPFAIRGVLRPPRVQGWNETKPVAWMKWWDFHQTFWQIFQDSLNLELNAAVEEVNQVLLLLTLWWSFWFYSWNDWRLQHFFRDWLKKWPFEHSKSSDPPNDKAEGSTWKNGATKTSLRRSNWVTYMKRSLWRQIFIVKNGRMIFGFNTNVLASTVFRCMQICSAFGYCQVLHSEEAYAAEVNRGWHWLV